LNCILTQRRQDAKNGEQVRKGKQTISPQRVLRVQERILDQAYKLATFREMEESGTVG